VQSVFIVSPLPNAQPSFVASRLATSRDRDVLGSIGGCASFDLLERGAGSKERGSRGRQSCATDC
jgi:hypothetical protein